MKDKKVEFDSKEFLSNYEISPVRKGVSRNREHRRLGPNVLS